MAGIRVNTPKGPDWEYSLDQVTWQASQKFMSQVDGTPFVVGTIYPVYCRNLVDKLLAFNSIPFGLKSSDDTIPVSLDMALKNGATTDTMAYYQGGISVDLETIPDTEAIHLVARGADGTFYQLDTDAKLNALFLAMLKTVKPNTPAQAVLCELAARCSIRTLYNFTNGIDYEALPAVVVIPPPLTPSYIGRFDINNCTEFSGWFVDINNPGMATPVRIERDGVVIANIVATRLRDDVRKDLIKQGKLPESVSFNTYGWVYTKQASDKDGIAHTFRAYGGTSGTIATTDGGINPTHTCGVTVVNPPPTNNPPQIVGLYPDQVVTAKGDQLLAAITGVYSDSDALTFSATLADGSPLPAGITFTPGDAKPFKVSGSFPNQQLDIKLIATDTAGQSTPKTFRLTVARPVVTGDPVTVVSRAFGGDTETIEGSGARVKVINTMSNGAQSDYTGGGTYRIIPFYPDQMTIQTEANAVGVITTKETVVDDVTVTLEFKFPDQSTITGPFTVRNKVAATSPVTGQLINDISFVEGSGGIVQLYDVHADGNWTEVTNSEGGRFELVGLYPNGMTISSGTTGRALVTTAGNSVTADVEVAVRYISPTGTVVNGVITVRNQSDPENPTPFVEKFALRVVSQANGEMSVQLLYKTNLPVGSQLEDCWTEFFTRQGQTPEFIPSSVVDNPASFPDGFKDYNVFMAYFMPVSLTQSHSTQHIKVRQTGTTNLLLDATFDPFALTNGQTKQYFPL